MKKNLIPSPSFVCEEELLKNNLEILKYVKDKSSAKILLALKGFALFSTFDLCSEYLDGCCASGLNEAILAKEEFKKEVHTFSPAFKKEEFEKIRAISDVVVFNSFNQYKKFKNGVKSIGLRVNPEVSTVKVDLYNPCGIYSRLGITLKEFEKIDLNELEIDGFHFHALCEQNVDDLEKVLEGFEKKFGKYIKLLNLKWVNFGGGHHITRKDYDVDRLIEVIKGFKERYNNIEVYLEPGEAVGWQTGYLKTTVLDIIHNGIDIAILDTSAETHMPDVLAMPYKPEVRYAKDSKDDRYKHLYRLGGNSCLAGDIIGDYYFDKELKVGDEIIFEDMIHYTMVKTTTFNGINLPTIVVKRLNGEYDIIKEFGYQDYKSRLS